MALYTRVSNHVFDDFPAFYKWMETQQFDFISNADRKPILKKGQKVFIRATGMLYGVLEDFSDIEEILEKDVRGSYLPQLRKDQDKVFRLFSPAIPDVELFTSVAPGTIDFKLGCNLITQNATINIAFETDEESFNRTSTLTVTNIGNVKINTGEYVIDYRTGEGNQQFRRNTEFTPSPNSTYALIAKSSDLIYMIETGRTSFSLEQEIPYVPSEAPADKGPSVQAVSKSLAEIRNLLENSVKEASGFLVYCGVNPITNTVERIKEDAYVLDIMYATNTESELPEPTRGDQISLVLHDQSTVKVLKTITISEPTYMPNSIYLGEGNFGTENVSANISKKYPAAYIGEIVGNFDTETEWRLTSLGWTDTRVPIGDSEYVHNSTYLGTYNPIESPSIQAKAIDMIYPLAKEGNIVNNNITKTEWEKGITSWSDTKNEIGTTPTTIRNPIIIGTFSYDPSDDAQVRAGLSFRYSDKLETGDIIYVTGSAEWMYDKATNDWTNTGNPEGTSLKIPNPDYLGTGSYGVGEDAANNLKLTITNAVAGNYIGNEDSNTDWKFDGEGWIDTSQIIGTYSQIDNPHYKGTYDFDKFNSAEVKTIMNVSFGNPMIGGIVYNNETGTEWKFTDTDGWDDTYRVNYSTPEQIPNNNIIGSFTYLESWTAPEKTLNLLFPNAKGNSYVFNESTGTIWKLVPETLAWIDTFEAYGEVPEDDPLFLGKSEYKTNPPTDNYILQRVYPNAKDGQFVWNLNSDSYIELVLRNWTDTGGKAKERFLYKEEGVYGWKEVNTSPITSGSLFHLLSVDTASRSEVYWFANTWNIVDFETITVPEASNEFSGTIKGSQAWGYVEIVEDSQGKSVGKVVGITNTGEGTKFLTDAGTYEYLDTLVFVTSDVDLYLNQESGNDDNTGYASDQAWQTPLKLAQWLKTNVLNYEYNPDKTDYPKRITLHLEGNAPDKDLVLDGLPYLIVTGKGMLNEYPCKMLQITNASVTLKDIAVRDRVVAWKSKLKTASHAMSFGIDLINSLWEQEVNSNFIFGNTDKPEKAVIRVDADSTMYHSAKITTQAELYSYTPFLEIKGRYVKGNDGRFFSEVNPRSGVKFKFFPETELIGVAIKWLEDNVPYEYLSSIDTDTPHVFPNVQTMYGTDEKSGFRIGDGTDILDVIKDKLKKANAVFDTLEEVYALPQEDRYVGYWFYVKQNERYYYFKGGTTNGHVKEYIVPEYNIQYRVKDGLYDWLNVFPFANVNEEGFLTDEPIYGDIMKPITWKTKI